MLSADSITFGTPDLFQYKAGGEIRFDLEKTDTIAVGKMFSSGNGGDIISVRTDTNTISVFKNDGKSNPTFAAPVTTVISGLKDKEYMFADVNKDGITDFIMLYEYTGTSTSSLKAHVYAGNTNGTFSTTYTAFTFANPFPTAGSTSNTIYIEECQIRDITGDGFPELFVSLKGISYADGAGTTTYKGSYYYKGESGGFNTTATTVVSHNTSFSSGTPLGFANVTSNANSLQLVSETITGANANSQQTLYFNSYNLSNNTLTSAGKFDYMKAFPTQTIFADVYTANSADEIISGITYTNNQSTAKYGVRVSHVSSLSTGTGPVAMNPSTPQVFEVDLNPLLMTVGDINNDGKPDIIVSDGTSYQVLLNTGNSFNVIGKVDSYANYVASSVGDYTGDGFQDTVVIGEKHAILLPGNPSHPKYNQGVILAEFPFKVAHAVFGDFTGDGYTDFMISSPITGTTQILYKGIQNTEQPGHEKLFSKGSDFSQPFPAALRVGNFITPAGGSKVDLAILRSGTMITIYSFDINGKVPEGNEKTIDLATYAVDFACGDLTGNGYDDIVTANQNQGTISIIKNNGNGTFSITSSIQVGDPVNQSSQAGSYTSNVAIADLNGDGLLDIGVLNSKDAEIKFYFQNSSRAFSETPSGRLSIPTLKSDSKYVMQFADFDLDGRTDVIVGCTASSGQQIAVYQNKGSVAGQFSNTPSWVPTVLLSGVSADEKHFWNLTVGYHTGNGSTQQTPGLVIVSGNSVYRIKNTTPADTSSGIFQIIIRDTDNTVLDVKQYDSLDGLSKLSWLNEWGRYYVEIWASSGSATEGISSFEFSMNYDTKLFATLPANIKTTSNFTLTSANVSNGVISVKGNSTAADIGKNKYVLLSQILVTPAPNTSTGLKENVGVPITP
ncbi:MAG: FG-GAP repeat domain-containing protein, partial [Thermoguttaceae bacterium]